MIDNNIYCKASGMVMQCIVNFQNEFGRLPIVCEIGSAEGEGILRYGGFCKKVIAVDYMARGRPDVFSKEKHDIAPDSDKLNTFRKNTDHRGYNVKLIIGSSAWEETLDEVKKELQDEEIDILLIDGAHHPEEAVQLDFDMYSPLVCKKGYIVFDDMYEKDISNVFDKAIQSDEWEEVESWEIRSTDILQSVSAVRKVK